MTTRRVSCQTPRDFWREWDAWHKEFSPDGPTLPAMCNLGFDADGYPVSATFFEVPR